MISQMTINLFLNYELNIQSFLVEVSVSMAVNDNDYHYWEPNNTSDGGVFHHINEFGGFIGDDTFSLNDLNITIDN